MSKAFDATIRSLRAASKKTDSVLVAFSGGKDSLVTLDLCRRSFKTVICFFMYFIPGLTHQESQLRKAEDRFGVQILHYPHWLLFKCLKNGICCNNPTETDSWPDIKLEHIYAMVRSDTGINLIAAGYKKTDSFWRRRNLHAIRGDENILCPIVEWNKFDVLAYMKQRNIEIPETSKANATGVDLSSKSVCWLHDTHKSDYDKLKELFPYAEAFIKRRQFYGIS